MFICKSKNTVGRLTSISKCFHPRHKSTCSAIQSLNEVPAVLWLAHLNIKGHGTENELMSVRKTCRQCKNGTACCRDCSLFQTFQNLSLLTQMNIKNSWTSGHYMYRTVVPICAASLAFTNSTFCPHSVFMCFVWIWEQTAIISPYSINWLVCITETECVYCAVRTEHLTFSNSTFCPHSVFMCFVWISEQTTIISLYSINWLVCITETGCVYCAVRTENLTFTNSTFCPRSVLVEPIKPPAKPWRWGRSYFPKSREISHLHAAVSHQSISPNCVAAKISKFIVHLLLLCCSRWYMYKEEV